MQNSKVLNFKDREKAVGLWLTEEYARAVAELILWAGHVPEAVSIIRLWAQPPMALRCGASLVHRHLDLGNFDLKQIKDGSWKLFWLSLRSIHPATAFDRRCGSRP